MAYRDNEGELEVEPSGYMRRALALADQARGRTSPNPPVGAVLVRRGRIVGEGFTRPAGESHAEVVALAQAGENARGAALYVTLEPCCHHGRTPPCVDAIVAAGVAEVHAALQDPNPRVAGQGLRELERRGVTVVLGDGERQAHELIRPFRKWVETGRPLVVAKWAMTLDGKIATHTGDSRWVSGELSRQRAHELRDVSDAIAVGIGTVIADDPELTARLVAPTRPQRAHQPLRVIVDSQARIPLGARVLAPDLAPGTLVACSETAPEAARAAIEAAGARVLPLPEQDGRVDLRSLLAALAQLNVLTLLVEGGGTLLGSLFEARLVDHVYAFIAPKIAGGASAITPVEGLGATRMGCALDLVEIRLERLGVDILLSGRPEGA